VKKSKLEKLVCYTADNTNSNFGGVKRKGEENVFRKVQSDLDRPILGIGCSAHIVHNSIQTACDSLPLDLEVIVIQIYKYLHIYTVRVTKLKQFCEFVETDYKKGLSCILASVILYGTVTRPTIQCAVGFKVGNLRAVKLIILHECCGYDLYYNVCTKWFKYDRD
jgi:hypothetical protein